MSKKKVANGKAKMVFFGMRQISNARLSSKYKYTRHYVAVETPDIVVKVSVILPKDHWQRKKRIDLDEALNSLAKKYFPKAQIFMFYNRVSSRGIVPPPTETFAREQFAIEKEFS